MCSRSEAFGRVTIEAMLRKKPVIGYMAGGTSELIEEGVTGFKFKNVDDVLNALGSLLGDGCLMQQMIDNAERRAKLYFSEDYYTNNVYGFVMDNNWK
jgi:glycosyltransferase involved in cell wall biosynthesis